MGTFTSHRAVSRLPRGGARFASQVEIPTTEDRSWADPAPKALTGATILYLGLPVVLFLAGWLRPSLAIPLAAGTTWAMVTIVRQWPQGTRPGISRRHLFTLVAAALVLAWLTGAGGFGYQTTDWWKHNAILHDLTTQPWPVRYKADTDFGLTYYLGYYLPPALIGKMFGWWAANVANLLWTAAGITLVLRWLVELVGRRNHAGLAVVAALGGLDVVGWLVFEPISGTSPPIFVQYEGIELWNGNFVMPTPLTHLLWATNHALGGWLAMAFIMHSVLIRGDRRSVIFVGAACTLWTPLVALGIAPFVLWDLLRNPSELRTKLKEMATAVNAVGAVIGLVLLTYYAAKLAPMPAQLTGALDPAFVFAKPRLPETSAWALAVGFGLFAVLEVAVVFGAVAQTGVLRPLERRWFRVAAVVFIAFIPIRVGENHDLLLRSTMPAMFMLAVLAARSLPRLPARSVHRTVFLVVMFIASLTSLLEIRRNLAEPQFPFHSFSNADAVPSVPSVYGGSEYMSQYTASTDSFFFRVLAADSPALIGSNDEGIRP